jgi:hypothetical protein
MADLVNRPTLTLPPDEGAALIAAYQGAGVILEYGTGGSTVVAADLARVVFSVESSADWYAMMTEWFRQNPAKATVHLHHGDIGKTRQWGFPADNKQVAKWSNYPISVWDRADFQHPDVVLIDGRFRVACLYTTLLRITRPVRVLWDDYAGRPAYHKVEAVLGAPQMVGRMAIFDLTPTAFAPQQMASVIEAFLRPG